MLRIKELITQPLQQSSGFSLRRELLSLGLLIALSGAALIGAAPVLYAQDKADKAPTVLAARLGLKASDLAVKSKPEAYRANPVVEDASRGQQANGTDLSTSGASDVVGTLSVQDFQGTQLNLSNTHASADGFRNYLANWHTPNFARRDTGVSAWLFRDIAGGDNFDFWTSNGTDLGLDSVLTCFHSSHGVMSSNVYTTSLGANWGGRGWNASSDQMFLGGNNYGYGDERLRYMFWDTCQSIKVSGGNDPYSTWGTRSRGIRMIFGYDTNSLDSADYGRFLWEEWNKGKSLANAFFDASLRVYNGPINGSTFFTHQTPVVVAFGANQSEARARVNNERYFEWGAVSNNWAEWSWVTPRSFADANAQKLLSLPEQEFLSQLAPTGIRQVTAQSNADREVAKLARAIGINLPDASLIQERPFGVRAVQAKGARLLLEKNGNFELLIEPASSEIKEGEALADGELIAKAQEIAQQLSSVSGLETRVGVIYDLNENGGNEGFQGTPRIVEKTIVFDQLIAGLPFVDPEAGHLQISFNARSGKVTRVRGSFQQVAAASETSLVAATPRTISEARAAALQSFASVITREAAQQQLEVVEGSEEIGYQVIDGKAVPVYRALIKDARFASGRPQQAIIPLFAAK